MITIDNPSLPLAISEAESDPSTSPEAQSGALTDEQTKPVTVNQPDKAGEQLATTIRVTLPSEARLEDG